MKREPAAGVARELAGARGWVLDVDGCLVRTAEAGGEGGTAIAGALDFVRAIKGCGGRIVVCTNASLRTPEHYLAHLHHLGFPLEAAEFVTAGSAAAEYIARHHAGAAVLAVGEIGIVGPLRAQGVDVVEPADAGRARVVLVGAAKNYSSAALDAACVAVDAGAPFYVTVDTPWFYGGVGRAVSSASAIAAAVAWVTGRAPTTLGKPSVALGETLARRLGATGGQTVVVGDATIEIALARAMGARSVLVLSGATRAADVDRLAGSERPDVIVDDVGDLYRLIQAHLAYDRSPA